MAMLFSGNKYEYRMNPEQYQEMKDFYKELGFSDKQVAKLCSNCFGADIKVDKSAVYNPGWCFGRNTKRLTSEPVFRRRAVESNAKGLRGAPPTEGLCEPELCVEECCPEPEPMMAAAAVMPGMAMPGMAMQGMAESADFNTSETEVTREAEQQSPLDNPAAIFSANVNTASWSYIRNKVRTSSNIDKNYVRIEEILNSYHYKLKKPADDELFSISTEKGMCPWQDGDELFLVGLRGKKAEKGVRQNLCLLVDVSGSMDSRWVLVQMSMASIISKLRKGDKLSIIAYSDETVTVAKDLDGGDMSACVKAILSIDGIGGCTNGSEGLTNAYAYLEENYDKDGNNRVFIFTDGDFNFGITAKGGLKDFIKEKRETGIYLSIAGYGYNNFKDDKMEALAQNGNGNYTFISCPEDILDELHDKLVSKLVTIAKDVKISVELNPQFVSKYRLLGYEARVLTQQEFHDTKKATDGIGSEHNVVALIQFTRGKAEKRFSSRYVNTSTADNNTEFAFIEVHYKDPDGNNLVMTKAVTLGELEGAKNRNIPVAALLGAFGLIIRNSEYKGAADKKLLAEMLKELDGSDKYDTKKKNSHFDIIKMYCGKELIDR